MFRTLRHHLLVKQALAVMAFMLGVLILLNAAPASAQGVPASVTSQGFGGNFSRSPGVPASVTSSGRIAVSRPGVAPIPHPHGPGHNGNPHHHHPGVGFNGGYGVVYYGGPYDYDTTDANAQAQQDAQQQAIEEQQQYQGGPTIFDRRGPGTPDLEANQDVPRPPAQSAALDQTPAPPRSVPDQPQTVLVFKDGHKLEVSNYAIVGATLFDLTPGHRRKVAISELDLTATTKENDDRGVDFKLPPGVPGV